MMSNSAFPIFRTALRTRPKRNAELIVFDVLDPDTPIQDPLNAMNLFATEGIDIMNFGEGRVKVLAVLRLLWPVLVVRVLRVQWLSCVVDCGCRRCALSP